MRKSVMQNMRLDKQVEQYLFDPILMTDIREYRLHRSHTGMTVLTLEIILDSKRFDELAKEQE